MLINLEVHGGQQAANDMNVVADSVGNLDDKARSATTKFGGLASASSALGTILSQTNPVVGGLASALGTAGGAASGLTTLLGGVGGLAVGGLIAALGLAVTWFVKTKDSAEDFGESMEDLTRTEGGIAKYIKMLETMNEEEEFSIKIKTNKVSAMEAEALIMMEQEKIALRMIEIRRLAAGDWMLDEEVEKAMISKLNRQNEASKEFIANQEIVIQNARDNAEMDRINLQNIRNMEAWDKYHAMFKGKKGKEDDPFSDLLLKDDDIFRRWEDLHDHVEEVHNESVAFGMDVLGILDDWELMELELADMRRKEEEAQRTREEGRKKFEQGWQGSLGIVQGGFNDLAANMIMGQEINLEALVQMVGTQIVKDGLKNMWVAGGLLLNPLTAGSGGALMAYAGAEIAAGAAMGAVAGAAGGKSGGSGGAPQRQGRPLSSVREERPQQAAPVTINVKTLNPSQEVGKQIVGSLNEWANKTGGFGVSRNTKRALTR
jgi:hypothetical protein